jgi:chromate reductase, NAD(P)H dehydrogenase (quinone)
MDKGRMKIVGIPGSLRRASFNRGLLVAAQEVAPADVAIEILDLAPIPFYNADVEELGLPEPVVALRERIAEADALLLTVPEYNHSYTAVLKNALDWASRPRPLSALRQKPVALMGAGGGSGTMRAQLAIRPVLAVNEAYVMPKPELYIVNAPQRFDADGNLTDATVRETVRDIVVALAAWTRRLRAD